MLKRFSSLKTLGLAELRRQPMQANYLYLNSIQKSYFSTNEEKKDKKPLPVKKERKKESFKKRLFDKNKERLKHLLKEFVHLVVHGSKSAFKDSKYALSVISSKPKASYTIEEIREISRIKKDLTKFVPFYAAILIPGGELALPPYLFLFPRAMPSYFRTEASFKDERYKYIDNQARAYKVLRQYLLSAMIKTGYDPSTKDPEGVNKYFEENYQRILPLLDFSKMDSETLKCSSDFLMFEYVEGTYILNLLYKTIVNFPRYMINATMWITRQNYRAVWTHPFFTTTFKMNFFPFEFFKKYFILFQLRRHLRVVKHQNYSIILNQFGSLKEETVLDVARERGYYADKEEEARKWLKEDYTKVVKQNIENDQYLFWHSVILYEHHS